MNLKMGNTDVVVAVFLSGGSKLTSLIIADGTFLAERRSNIEAAASLLLTPSKKM